MSEIDNSRLKCLERRMDSLEARWRSFAATDSEVSAEEPCDCYQGAGWTLPCRNCGLTWVKHRAYKIDRSAEPEQPAGLSEHWIDVTKATLINCSVTVHPDGPVVIKGEAPPAEARVCEYVDVSSDVGDRLFHITCQPGITCYFPVGWIKDYCCYCGGKIAQREVK